MIRFVLLRHSLRHVGVIALTAPNNERCVVCSRFKHQLSQPCLEFAQNFLKFVSHGKAPRFGGGLWQRQPPKRRAPRMQMACVPRNQHPCLKQRLPGPKHLLVPMRMRKIGAIVQAIAPNSPRNAAAEASPPQAASTSPRPTVAVWRGLSIRRAWPSPFWLPLCISARPWLSKSIRTSKEFRQHSLVS